MTGTPHGTGAPQVLRDALRQIADIHHHTEDCSIRDPLTGGYTDRPCNCDHDDIVAIIDAALASEAAPVLRCAYCNEPWPCASVRHVSVLDIPGGEPTTAAGRRFVDRHGTGKQGEIVDIENEARGDAAESLAGLRSALREVRAIAEDGWDIAAMDETPGSADHVVSAMDDIITVINAALEAAGPEPVPAATEDALENDIRELRGAMPGELAHRLVERGWTRAAAPQELSR